MLKLLENTAGSYRECRSFGHKDSSTYWEAYPLRTLPDPEPVVHSACEGENETYSLLLGEFNRRDRGRNKIESNTISVTTKKTLDNRRSDYRSATLCFYHSVRCNGFSRIQPNKPYTDSSKQKTVQAGEYIEMYELQTTVQGRSQQNWTNREDQKKNKTEFKT